MRHRHRHQQILVVDEMCLLYPKLWCSPSYFEVARYIRRVKIAYGTFPVKSQDDKRYATDLRQQIDQQGTHADISSIGYSKSRFQSLAHRIYTLLTSIYSARLSSKLSLPSPLHFHPPKGKSQHPVRLVQFTPTMPFFSFLLTRIAR